ncbi:hypothetical protein HQ496_03110, partial [bacterium]|nr:hypothetical protein [bacterium]
IYGNQWGCAVGPAGWSLDGGQTYGPPRTIVMVEWEFLSRIQGLFFTVREEVPEKNWLSAVEPSHPPNWFFEVTHPRNQLGERLAFYLVVIGKFSNQLETSRSLLFLNSSDFGIDLLD